MRFTAKAALALGLSAIAATGPGVPVSAHHSYAMFDRKQPLTLTGRVTQVQWKNPHAYVFMEARGPDGVTRRYLLECSSPNELVRWGWKANTVKSGDIITADLYMLRDGRPGGLLFKMTTADGKAYHAH